MKSLGLTGTFLLGCVGAIAAVGGAVPARADDGAFRAGETVAGAHGAGVLRIAGRDGRATTPPPETYRFGTSLFSAIEPYAALRPWLGTERTPGRSSFGVGGILVDVPLGDFIFTPSFGGGRYSENDGRDQTSAMQFRSSLGLGYRFDDQSRFSLDFSRTTTTAPTIGGPVGGSALSFTYRIPSAVLLGK